MRFSSGDLVDLADLAVAAASEAGQMIARSRPRQVERKAGASLASQVVTEIDRRSEAIIVDTLTPTLAGCELGILTEERTDDRSRLVADYFWCVDPLDGTLPFVEGAPGYAVSIALVGRDGTPWIGVVYDPVEAVVVHAIRGVGAFLGGSPWQTHAQSKSDESQADVLSVFADRSFAARDDNDAIVHALSEIARDRGLSGLRVHPTRGAVMNAVGVLTHAAACYFKHPAQAGGGSLWDFAATACLFREAGAVATNMFGGPLDLNRADSSFMNHEGVLFATDERLAGQIRTLV